MAITPTAEATPINEGRVPMTVEPLAPAAPGPAEFKLVLEQERERQHLVEEYILNELVAGEDYGVAHDGRCRQKNWQGLGRCPSCHRKPDLWLPGAEKVAKRQRCAFTEPQVAHDIMAAVDPQGQGGWIAFRTSVISMENGVIWGHGIGARSMAQSGNDHNTMIKMGKKSSIIDAAKTGFALSSFFTQDGSDAEESTATAPPTPAPAPSKPARGISTETNYEKEVRGMIARIGVTKDEHGAMFRLTGWDGKTALKTSNWASVRDLLMQFREHATQHGVTGATPTDELHALFTAWLTNFSEQSMKRPLPASEEEIAKKAAACTSIVSEVCGLGFEDRDRLLRLVGWTDQSSRDPYFVPLHALLTGPFREALRGMKSGSAELTEAAKHWIAEREQEIEA